jgi:tetratricopeptide (TPR) repeat protein
VSEPTGAPQSAGLSAEIHHNVFQGVTPLHAGPGDQYNILPANSVPGLRALAGLPAAPSGFVGRSEYLAVLLEALDPRSPADRAVLVAAVGGLAGIGKTALVLQAAHQAVGAGWFAGAIFLDLHGYDPVEKVDPSRAVAVLMRMLGTRDDQMPPTADEQYAAYRTLLAGLAGNGEPVLLVLDNASSAGQVDPLLPGRGGHRVLITSRHALADLSARLIDLDALDTEQAAALVAAALRTARPDDARASSGPDMVRLAELCAGLPLALQIAAALLKASPRRSVASLVAELEDERTRLELLSAQDAGMSVGVRAAFELSYRQLSTEQARLFRLLAINPGPDTSTEAASALTGEPQPTVLGLLYGLERAHLVSADEEGKRWRMHDLIRIYAQGLLDTTPQGYDREGARDRLLGFYLANAKAADHQLRSLAGREEPGRFTNKHAAIAWLGSHRLNLIGAIALATDSGQPESAAKLASYLGEYLQRSRHLDDWVATSRQAIQAIHEIGDPHRLAGASSNLGLALGEVRQFEEAIDAHRAAITMFLQLGDLHSEGIALHNLAIALREVRRFEEAFDAHHRALTIFTGVGDVHGEAVALNNLGLTLRDVRRFGDAITAHRRASEIYHSSGDLHGQAQALNNLGTTLQEVRRFGDAVDAHRQAAKLFAESGDAHGEGTAWGNLGLALREIGESEQAIDAHQHALTIYMNFGDRRSEGLTLSNLGLALEGTGRLDEMLDVHRRAIEIARKVGDRYGEAQALNNQGLALQEAGRFEDAVDAHRDAFAIYTDLGDHHGQGSATSNRGLALQEAGRFEEAADAHREAFAIYTDLGDLYYQATTLCNLGSVQHLLKLPEACQASWERAAELFDQMGAQAETISVRSVLARLAADWPRGHT